LALSLHTNHYGKTDLVELQIDLEPGTVPKRSKVRLLKPDQKRKLKDQIDEWLEQGIEPDNSPWALPLFPVKKKDGRTRWVTDLILLKSATVKDAIIFTSTDACGTYHCVQI